MLPDAMSSIDVLSEIQRRKRSGLARTADGLKPLLRALNDALDMDAAGALLRNAQSQLIGVDGGFREQRIMLLGSSTLHMLPNILTTSLLGEGIVSKIRLSGYNGWHLEILDGASELKDFGPRIVACLLDDQAVFEGIANPLDLAEVEAHCAAFLQQLAHWVDTCQRAFSGLLVLCTLPLGSLRRDRLIDYRSKARLEAAWHHMNAAILGLAITRPYTIVLSANGLATHAREVFAADRMRHTAGQVFAPDFLRAYAAELTRVARADLGLTRKCLALDLDNTLWGGIVGDEGVGALQLGGPYPASAFKELQVLARDLMGQGVILTVCSKNDADAAHEALEKHPEMVLRLDSFVAITANWEPKSDNLRAQAARLNLSEEAIVFVDDNPAERELVQRLAPLVETVDLPAEPASFASYLAGRGDFNLLELTEEDRKRTAQYQAEAKYAEIEHSTSNLEEYLESLDSRLDVEPVGPLNIKRIVQLFAKTNQFNLTGLRYGEAEITSAREREAGAFFGMRLVDRFSDHGLIAALALAKEPSGAWIIKNFVLSCRVFSRRIEDVIVGLVLRAAQARGVPAVLAPFVETPKNQKFSGFYPSQGFVRAQGDSSPSYRHDLRWLTELPGWVRITQGLDVPHAF